ncbi:27751_t:CDS:2, partial [Dentiscutata erythropus]
MEIHYFQASIYTIEYEQPDIEDLRIVVGVGFAYDYIQDNKAKIKVLVNEDWGNFKSPSKTNTVLQYDKSYREVVNWEAGTLSLEPSRRKKLNLPKPVKYFKFYLGDASKSKRPKLLPSITFEKAITDYLHEIEFNENSKTIMRRCIYNAGLIQNIGTLNLQFTTEPEAASIHCMNKLKELNLTTGSTYLVVDCGGGTMDLTVRKLLSNNRIAETTERTGDFCGGTYVDGEFLKVLEERVDIAKILRLIREQLSKCSNCSVLFLVRGFGESKYLQSRIKERFENQVIVAAVVSDACEYELDMKIVITRVLKWSYGVLISSLWKTGDPPSHKRSNGRIQKFNLLARKGTEVDVNEEFSDSLVPVYPDQTSILFQFFYTTEYNATYCNEPGMKKLGSFEVKGLPTEKSGLDHSVLITLRFASMENTVATAKSKHS